MALVDQVVPVSFGEGFDTKTDPKSVQAKVLQLIDGVFTNPKRISKRNGNTGLSNVIDGGGTLTNPLLTKSYNNELVCADGTNLYSYSPTLGVGAWVPKGSYQSVSVNEKLISTNFTGALGVVTPSIASNGSYTIAAYTDGNGSVYVSVMDNSSQAFLIQDVVLAAGSAPQAACLSGTTLAVLYNSVGNNLEIITASFGSSSVTFSAPSLVAAALDSSAPNITFTTNGAFNFVTALKTGATFFVVVSLSSSGSVITSTSPAISGTPGYIQCQIDASNNVWVYYVDIASASSETLYYYIYSSSLSLAKAKTTIVSGLANVSNISPSVQVNGNQFIYYSTNIEAINTSTPNYVTTQYAIVSTTAVISTNNAFLTNVEIETKWVNVSGINYAVFGTVPGNVQGAQENSQVDIGNQTTYFLISESTKICIAKCFSGEAVTGTTATGIDSGYLRSIFVSGTSIIFGAAYIFFKNVINTLSSLDFIPLTGLSLVNFNFDDFESYQAVNPGNILALNGGVVQMYDGKQVTELGFNQYPENIVVTVSGSSGGLSSGNYTWAATYEWYDATGNFHVSAPQETAVIAVTSTNSASIDIQTIAITEKVGPGGIVIVLYRTTVNGTIFYKVNQVKNDPTMNKVTLTDAVPDTEIQGIADLQLYTTGGVVDNIAPPPAMVMNVINNRLELVDSESPTNTFWYSKTYSPGNGIAMSDLLTVTIDPRFGNITTLILMDANMVVLKENGAFILTGDGADDTGQNSTFTNPQVIPSDVGCEYSRGSILIPDGVMFKTTKGIYLLSRGLSITYFGAEAEGFNSQNIESALIAPNTSQCRFLTSSGYSLVYDYIFKKWGAFSNYQGYSATVWNDEYVYCRTDGSIYMENTSTFLDGATPYALTVQLAWIKLAGIQGFQRIRKCLLLGDQISPSAGHAVQISAAYDFIQSFSTPIQSPPFPTNGSSTPLQYRNFFPRQKCDSISLLIQEVVTGASGEYLDITDLSLNIGLKKGLNKVSAAQSVG